MSIAATCDTSNTNTSHFGFVMSLTNCLLATPQKNLLTKSKFIRKNA
nr:MAG TPA: hypothetical protein [Caudoviricetes sp.]